MNSIRCDSTPPTSFGATAEFNELLATPTATNTLSSIPPAFVKVKTPPRVSSVGIMKDSPRQFQKYSEYARDIIENTRHSQRSKVLIATFVPYNPLKAHYPYNTSMCRELFSTDSPFALQEKRSRPPPQPATATKFDDGIGPLAFKPAPVADSTGDVSLDADNGIDTALSALNAEINTSEVEEDELSDELEVQLGLELDAANSLFFALERPKWGNEKPAKKRQWIDTRCDICRDSRTRCGRGKPACLTCKFMGIRCVYSKQPSLSLNTPPSSHREEITRVRMKHLIKIVEHTIKLV